MFDKRRAAFLDSARFVFQAFDRADPARPLFPLGLALLCLGGCVPRPEPGPTEDTLTSGRIVVVSVPEADSLVERLRSAFVGLYPQADIELRSGSSRHAMAALLAAEGDLAVIARELEAEEGQAAAEGGVRLQGYRFARDAVALIVNESNPVENLGLDEFRAIYRGDIRAWDALGGSAGPIRPVVQPPEEGITRYLVSEVLEGQTPVVAAFRAASDSEVVARVRSDPGAIGYVSLAWSDRGARTLRVSHALGLSYLLPDLEAVYRGQYPLTRFYNLFVREDGRRLAHGFITFVTSFEGQRIVHESGLVPTTVPVRFVRRSPMLGTH